MREIALKRWAHVIRVSKKDFKQARRENAAKAAKARIGLKHTPEAIAKIRAARLLRAS
jgi:hypothetical protein